MNAWNAPEVKKLLGFFARRDFHAARTRADQWRHAQFLYEVTGEFIALPEPELDDERQVADLVWLAHECDSDYTRRYIRKRQKELGVSILAPVMG